MDRLRWFWSLKYSDKLRYVAKTIEDMDGILADKGILPIDWRDYPNNMNYDAWIRSVVRDMRARADALDKEKS